MIWFGSSAGVAFSNMYPEAKTAGNWLRHGRHVTLAYVVGFAVTMFTLRWQPHERHKGPRFPRWRAPRPRTSGEISAPGSLWRCGALDFEPSWE